jgi:RNA polymerase sigma-70 factor, ECF subfamily
MFILDTWNDLLRFAFWMAPTRPLAGRTPPSGGAGGGGTGSGSAGGGDEEDDPENFEAIFKRHFEKVLRYFLRKGAPRESGMDLTQETFLRVYQSIGEFRQESSFQTWLFRIAENTWLNALRHRSAGKRKGIETPLPAAEEAPEIPESQHLEGWGSSQGALEKVLAEERQRRLYEALSHLPRRMRECVFYRVHHDLKYREIAALMGTSIGAVKAQLAQAKSRLEEELGPYFDSF